MNKSSRILLLLAAGLTALGSVLLAAAWLLGARPAQLLETNFSGLSLGPGSGVSIIGHSGYRDWQNDYAADGRYTASPRDVDSVELDWIAGDVEVQAYKGAEIAFSETSADPIGEDTALRWGIGDGTLYIQYCSPQAGGDLPIKNLTLLLPEALAAGLDEFSFSGISARLTASGLAARRLSASGTSGELSFTDSRAGRVTLSAISGALRFSGAFSQLDASSTSGEIAVDSAELGAVSASSISGSVTVTGGLSEVGADTTSGSVTVRTDTCPKRTDINTISGSVELILPADSSFTLNFDTVSGALDCGFPVVMRSGEYICGDGDAVLDVDTTSGSLRISP